MFKYFKDRFRLSQTKTELEISEAMKMTAQNRLIEKQLSEASNIVRDRDLENGWLISGGRGGTYTDAGEVFDEAGHYKMLNTAFTLFHTNVHARAIVRGLVKFVLGKGPIIEPEEEASKTKDELKKIWGDFCKRNRFNIKEKEIATRMFRDGETFIRLNRDTTEGDLDIRFIRANSIKNPIDRPNLVNVSYGIQCEDNDIETVKYYYIVNGDGNFKERLPAEDVIRLKILTDSDQKRGVSVFFVCAKRLTQHEEWLDDRIILNKVRSSIALVRTTEGSGAKIQTIRDQNLSTENPSSKNMQKMFKGGTIITASPGIKYELLSANINASDAAEDGRNMLLSIAASVGFPEMLFTADYCHDSDTEVLSEYGFVDPNTACENNYKLGTVNPVSGRLEYDSPTDWIFSNYDGPMYLFEGRRLNFSVTQNHNMWLRSESVHKLPEYRTDRSIEGFEKSVLSETSKWRTKVCSIRDFVEPTENNLSNSFIKVKRYNYPSNTDHMVEGTIKDQDRDFHIKHMVDFIGWFVSEGCVNEKGGGINICQSIEKNSRNVNRIDSLLKKLPIEYSISDYKDLGLSKGVVRYWRMNDSGLASWLRVNCGIGAKNKRLPRFIWDLPIRLRERLLNVLIFGDGSDNRSRNDGSTGRRFCSTSVRLLNDVQRLAFELGYHATANFEYGYVDISSGHNCMVQRKDIQKVDYHGLIWCATVPSGLLVTRRKGKILVSGNSNANYSSSLIAQNPFVREIEEWQDYLTTFYKDLYRYVIEAKIEYGDLAEDVSTECRVSFPPMLRDDIDKLAKAYEVLFKYRVVSKRTWRGKMGLDDDVETGYIEDEGEDDATGTSPPNIPGQIPGQLPGQPAPNAGGKVGPFNMPIAPINQFGAVSEEMLAELMTALKNKDWETVTDMVDRIEEAESANSEDASKN